MNTEETKTETETEPTTTGLTTRTITMKLPCVMTADEAAHVADEIDETIEQMDDLEAQAKSSATDYRARLSACAEKLNRLSSQRRSRRIGREVEVAITTDVGRAEETQMRTDTGEILSRRTLTKAELEELRQAKLPGVDAPVNDGDDPWEAAPKEVQEIVQGVRNDDPLDGVEKDRIVAAVVWGRDAGLGPTDRVIKAMVRIAARKQRGNGHG